MFSNATLAQALLTVYDYSAYALRGQKVSTNLIRKPDTLWTACLKLVRILVSPFEKKYETVDGPPSRAVNGISTVAYRIRFNLAEALPLHSIFSRRWCRRFMGDSIQV
ncbi:MAG: hypothetical protein LQ345_001285 [Seirophora villosa]|nr:MAG: hypothetical protein LQ345_001285 [Seirophora villosa]